MAQKLVGPFVYTGVTNDHNSEVATSGDSCYPYSFHYGVDLVGRKADGTTIDTQIKASGSGEVVSIRKPANPESTALGNVIVIRYPNVLNKYGGNVGDVYFRYCHVTNIRVTEGEYVTAATTIANRGTSGYGCAENSPHLHLEATQSSNATAYNSPSEGYTDVNKFNPRNVLYTKTSSTGTIGKRVLVVDCEPPFNSNATCSHGKKWYSTTAAPSYD